MQATTWVQKHWQENLMLICVFSQQDDEGNEKLQWCQGIVLQSHSDELKEKKCISVLITWKDTYVVDGDSNPTREC